ncbi:MAG: undecaprenyldiphospho-muramoylpentapeptide beta-N-acetylglucosaminyltransferase, partial [Chloroflexota bacterium]
MAKGSEATVSLLWVGTVNGMEAGLVRAANIRFEAVRAAGVVGRGLWGGLAGCLQLALGIVQALLIMRRERPHAVLVTGGYAAVPVALAAWLRRVPVLVYLPDILPGQAVRFVARLATRVCVTMDES